MRKAILLSIVGVILFNLFFYRVHLESGLALLFILLNGFFFFTRHNKPRNLVLALSCSTLSIIFSLLFAYRANGIVQFFNCFAAMLFALLACAFYKQEEKFALSVPSFLLLPLRTIKQAMASLVSKNVWHIPLVKKESVTAVLRGIGITIPVIIVLFWLLTTADPAFAKLSRDLFNGFGERLILSVIVFICLVAFGIAKVTEKSNKEKQLMHVSSAKILELSIITGSIIVLFSLFIGVQFHYLFSKVGELELHKLGIMSLTYSEYVRKGFVELLIAAGIASSVIIYVLRYLHLMPEKQRRILQLVSGVLAIETAVLLLSDAQRIFLYADAHGLTRARIFGFIFLVWLAGLLLIFLFSIIKKNKPAPFFLQIFMTSILAVFSISFLNIDGLIATKYPPTVNHEVDYYYLSTLSTDAYSSWKPAIQDIEKTVVPLSPRTSFTEEEIRKLYWARRTTSQLDVQVTSLINKYGTDKQVPWQAYNMSEYMAYKAVASDLQYYRKIQSLQKTIDHKFRLLQKKDQDILYNAPLDRSTQAPLTR